MESLGLIGALYMGSQSLLNNSLATQVAGSDIANANTAGASAQVVNFATNVPLNLNGVGQQGTGANVSSIQSLRSSLLDNLVVGQQKIQGFYNQQSTLSQLVQSALGENLTTSSTDSTSDAQTSLQSSINNFFSAFSSLASSPNSTSARQQVIDSAQSLTENLNTTYNNVLSVQSGVASDATTTTASINQIASTIAGINQQIIAVQSATGQPANQLIDQREEQIEQLSSLVNISTSPQANGTVNISLADAPSVILVSGVNSGGTGGTQTLSSTYSTSSNPPLTVSASTSGALGSDIPSGGQLGADLNVANDLIGSGASVGNTGVLGQLDTLANNIVSAVNTQSQAGYDLYGNAGGDFFTSSSTGAADMSVNSAVLADPNLIAASDGSGSLSGVNATAIANLQNNSTIGPAEIATTAFVGNYASQALENQQNQQLVTTQVQQQRDSVSGISVDTEMTNLVTFQRSYEASAQFINTISSMMDTLIKATSTS